MKIFGKYLNPEELAVGAIHAGVWIPFLSWFSFLIVPLCSFLWAWGGAEGTSKLWRRLGVPISLCCGAAFCSNSWIPLVSIPFGFLVLCQGYGIPSWNGPDGSMDDEGSTLGQWVYIQVKGSLTGPDKEAEKKANMITRAILATLFGVAMLTFIYMSFTWWIIGTVLLTFLIPIVVEAV